jgi:hypothetical protein
MAFDLIDRVQHRCVMFIAELPPDLWEGHAGDSLAQVHADLSRNSNGFGIVARFEVLDTHSVIIRNGLLNHLDRDGFFVGVKDLAESVLCKRQSYFASVERSECDQADQGALQFPYV